MKYPSPYLKVADVHAHDWSQFSGVGSDGVNTRLRIILDELKRAAGELQAAGGYIMTIDGDLFHVRGKIAPSVFNPTYDAIREIAETGVRIEIIAGNHDLEGKDATKLGNAMQQLQQIPGVTVHVQPAIVHNNLLMVPWIEDLDRLRTLLRGFATKLGAKAAQIDVALHAPLNGVIKGIPDACLDPAELAALGFRRVFAGHFHNHVDFGGGVYSVGATTHQTWNDPGTKAGFLLVYEDRVEHHESKAPKFVNWDGDDIVDDDYFEGNYVRLRLQDAEESIIRDMRQAIMDRGALGIVDHSSKKRTVTRSNATAQTGSTLEMSVSSFVGEHLQTSLDKAKIEQEALAVLGEAKMRSLAA